MRFLELAFILLSKSELFDNIDRWWDWELLSRDLNQRLENYKQAGRTITDGLTHNDWQMLEEDCVSQVIYDGGNTPGVLLLKKCGSLQILWLSLI